MHDLGLEGCEAVAWLPSGGALAVAAPHDERGELLLWVPRGNAWELAQALQGRAHTGLGLLSAGRRSSLRKQKANGGECKKVAGLVAGRDEAGGGRGGQHRADLGGLPRSELDGPAGAADREAAHRRRDLGGVVAAWGEGTAPRCRRGTALGLSGMQIRCTLENRTPANVHFSKLKGHSAESCFCERAFYGFGERLRNVLA